MSKGHKGNPRIHSNSAYGADSIKNILLKYPDEISFETTLPYFKKRTQYYTPSLSNIPDYSKLLEEIYNYKSNLNYHLSNTKTWPNDRIIELFEEMMKHTIDDSPFAYEYFHKYLKKATLYGFIYKEAMIDLWKIFWLYYKANGPKKISDSYLAHMMLWLYYIDKRGHDIKSFLKLYNIESKYYKMRPIYDKFMTLSNVIYKHTDGYIFRVPKILIPLYYFALHLRLLNKPYKEWSESDKENYIVLLLNGLNLSHSLDINELELERLTKYYKRYSFYDLYTKYRHKIIDIVNKPGIIDFDALLKIKEPFSSYKDIEELVNSNESINEIITVSELLQLLGMKKEEGKKLLSNKYMKAYISLMAILNKPLVDKYNTILYKDSIKLDLNNLKNKDIDDIKSYLAEYLFISSLLTRIEKKYGIRGLKRYFDKSIDTNPQKIKSIIQYYNLESEMNKCKEAIKKFLDDNTKEQYEIYSDNPFQDEFKMPDFDKSLPKYLSAQIQYKLKYAYNKLFSYYFKVQIYDVPLITYMDEQLMKMLDIITFIPIPQKIRERYKPSILEFKNHLETDIKRSLEKIDEYIKKGHLTNNDEYFDYANGLQAKLKKNGYPSDWVHYYAELRFLDYILNDPNASLYELKNYKKIARIIGNPEKSHLSEEDKIYISYFVHFFIKDIKFGKSKVIRG